MTDDIPSTVHIPILLEPIVSSLIEPFRALAPNAPVHWIVDCTLGGGGHTSAFLAALATDPKLARHKVLSVDQDEGAIERARARFAREIEEGRLELKHSRFGEIDLSDRPVLGLMADLGFSSDQIEDADRGLSFRSDGPLDMRLDPSRGRSALDLLHQLSEREIADILYEYGEERLSRRIAASIIERRRAGQIPRTTHALAELVSYCYPAAQRHGRIHPATRTFQALRIAVNDELGELDSLLERVILGVVAGGRIAILSFHSLEDRKVKTTFRESEVFEALSKKPLEADEEETQRNPRSRSAKLRIAQRLG